MLGRLVSVGVWGQPRPVLQVIMFSCRLKRTFEIGVKHLLQIIDALVLFRIEAGQWRKGRVCVSSFQSVSSCGSSLRGSSAILNLSAMASSIC